jgi:hypothetical protein
MRTRSFLTATALVVVAAFGATTACGTSNSEDPAAAEKEKERDQARAFYLTRVHVRVDTCVGCHAGASGPRFMAPDAEGSYDAIARTVGLISAPKNSPLVQYVHKNPDIAISPEQRSIVTQWLSLEATARGLAGAVDKPKTATEAYKQFADCMNYDIWSYYRMGDVSFAQTDTEGPCLGCHSTGQGSAWLSAGSRETFDKFKTFPFIQKLVVAKLGGSGSFESLEPSNRLIVKSNEECLADKASCHPRYGLPPEVTTGIRGFVDSTIQNLATDTCNSGIVVPTNVDAGPKDAGGG